LVKNESGDQVLRFYWLDAFEDQYKHPGNRFMIEVEDIPFFKRLNK